MMATGNPYMPHLHAAPPSHYHPYAAAHSARQAPAIPASSSSSSHARVAHSLPFAATAGAASHQHHQTHQWRTPSTPTHGSGGSSSSSSTGAIASSASAQRSTPSQQGLLVATGKKRRRLQRACTACHRAKRRCDGGLPCSNCDFSGRTCAYSDSQGKAVPPTKRSLRPSEAAMQEEQRQQMQMQMQMQMQQQQQQQETLAHQSYAQPYAASIAPSSPPQPHHVEGAQPPAPPPQQAGMASSSSSYIAQRNGHHAHRSSSASLQGISTHGHPSAINTSPSLGSARDPVAPYSPVSHNHVGVASPPLQNKDQAGPSSRRRTAVEPSPDVRRELLSIFFAEVQPWSCIVDEITLLRDLSSMTASPAIMFAIYALTSRYAVKMRKEDKRYARLAVEVGDGLAFAAEARHALQTEDASTGLSVLDGELTLETRQALCLLACFEYENGRFERAASYVQHCCHSLEQVRRRQTQQPRHGQRSTSQLDKRVVCLTIVLDVCIAVACGRTPSLRTWEIQKAIESLKRPACSSPIGATGRSNESSVDALTDAFVQLANVTLILSDAFDVHRRVRLLADSTDALLVVSEREVNRSANACEQHLQRWADQLSDALRFDEDNLRAVEESLSDQGGHRTMDDTHSLPSSWSAGFALCWSAIHSFAESATIVLQSAVGEPLPVAAAHNLRMILERSNPALFSGAIAAFGITMLKASSASVLDEGRRRTPSTIESDQMAAWSSLRHSADRLCAEARLSEASLSDAIAWLAVNKGKSAIESSSTNGRSWTASSMRPSWTTRSPPASLFALNTAGSIDNASRIGRDSNSPIQSSASINGQAPPSLKSRHSSSASSTTSSSAIGPTTNNHGLHQLPPLLGFPSSINPSSSSSISPNVAAKTVLPPLRFPSPEDVGNPHKRKWSSASSTDSVSAHESTHTAAHRHRSSPQRV